MEYIKIPTVATPETAEVNSSVDEGVQYKFVLTAVRNEDTHFDAQGNEGDDNYSPARDSKVLYAYGYISLEDEDSYVPTRLGANNLLRGLKLGSTADQAAAIKGKFIYHISYKNRTSTRGWATKTWTCSSVDKDAAPAKESGKAKA